MIDKVAFNGRETMLTAGIKKGAEETVNVVKASSILGREVQPKTLVAPQNVENLYTSPYATINPIENKIGEILNIFG